MPYEDRAEAGRLLAARLGSLKDRDCLILAIARGGVTLGYEIASALDAPLDVVVPRKLGAPDQPELAIGAVSSWGGGRVLDEQTIRILRISPEYIETETENQFREMDRRLMAYRGTAEPPDLSGKTAIFVDDGLATGYTMIAAIRGVRALRPERTVVAVPVAPWEAVQRVSSEVDEVICLEKPEPFMAVGYWYRDFRQVTDEEVVELLRRREHEIRKKAA
jgi:putative phosphoribosyl transferase